jgi:hypothetical protein
VLIPFGRFTKAASKISAALASRSQTEIGDAILKDIRERPRPSGNFTADTNEAPAAACPSLVHHQTRQLREVHRGAGPYLLMRGGLLFFRHKPPRSHFKRLERIGIPRFVARSKQIAQRKTTPAQFENKQHTSPVFNRPRVTPPKIHSPSRVWPYAPATIRSAASFFATFFS